MFNQQPRVPKGSLRRIRPQQANKKPYQSPFQNQQNQPNNHPKINTNYKNPQNDNWIRLQWKVGSKVEVYSNSAGTWFEGDIVRIFNDDEGEWLEVQYAAGNAMRLKQIPRDDHSAIRPVKSTINLNIGKPKSTTSNTNNTNTKPIFNNQNQNQINQPSLSATATIISSTQISPNNNLSKNIAILPYTGTTSTTATATATTTAKDPSLMTQDDIDLQIRNSWVRGSRVEVYSRGRKKWMRGLVTRVFTDNEGEWLEVRYGKNLVKETPRESPDIRPLRVRYRNRFKWTKYHENTITAIWEDVDLEHTRHLDRMLVSSVFRALNIDTSILKEGELDDVFAWIDTEERGAITVDEFINWMTNSVETIKQREIQQKMFNAIDATKNDGASGISKNLKAAEKKKLAAIYKSQFGKQFKKSDNPTINPSLFAPVAAATTSKSINTSNDDDDDNKGNDNDDDDDDGTEPMEIDDDDDDEMAEFSDQDDDDNDDDQVPPLISVSDMTDDQKQADLKEQLGLQHKLKDVGFSDKFLIATVASQKEEYHSKLISLAIKVALATNLRTELDAIQTYMKERVRKAGVDGMRMSELGNVVHRKFNPFSHKKYLNNFKATFSDFVSLCPGLVVVEMEGSNRRMERIAVTDSCALKINLKSKLQFVLTMLFDKGKITNRLEPIKLERDKYGRITKTRRLSVGERLISVSDFVDRIKSLGVDLNTLEGDELFWAVAGSNSTMISQKMVGRYFSSLIDHLDENLILPQISQILPKVINLARLRYRREPLWKKYIIIRTISRWNNISYLRLTDRRTRSKLYDMIVIPKTASVHGGDILDVQKSFHYTCHILNKLQYPTICKKIDHGSDKFNFCCVTKTPHLRSFPEMLNEALNKRNIVYSEYFISQVIGCVFETLLFCHKHDTVNFNLNIDSLGFDNNLRPILLDFSRSIVLSDDDKVSRFDSIMSSTPPELALLMGSNNPLMNIELNGSVLKKADSWRCGVLLYVLITGKLPYSSTSLGNFITNVLTLPPVEPIENITWCSDELKDLLIKLLETTYFNRINIEEALKHEWFKKISFTKDNPISLPENIQNNIINLCKLENARNWISTITHSPNYNTQKQLDRDRKYFGRLDPTGQRKQLKKDKLEIFICDRLSYCKYRSKQIISEYYSQVEYIQWKDFVDIYNQIKFLHPPNKNNDITSSVRQFTNAIFRGLDPKGNGYVESSLLLSLFQDINLKLQSVVNKLNMISKFTFEQCVSELAYSFKNGFDIKDLLSVDHVVQSL